MSTITGGQSFQNEVNLKNEYRLFMVSNWKELEVSNVGIIAHRNMNTWWWNILHLAFSWFYRLWWSGGYSKVKWLNLWNVIRNARYGWWSFKHTRIGCHQHFWIEPLPFHECATIHQRRGWMMNTLSDKRKVRMVDVYQQIADSKVIPSLVFLTVTLVCFPTVKNSKRRRFKYHLYFNNP